MAITRSGTAQDERRNRDLIRQMSLDSPLWGAPRVHGELLKFGIEVSQATVGRYLPRRPKAPSPTWRSFLRNHMAVIVAVDMFVVVTATFRMLYAVIVLDHHRRRVIHFEVTRNPTQVWLEILSYLFHNLADALSVGRVPSATFSSSGQMIRKLRTKCAPFFRIARLWGLYVPRIV
jgi:hypothetical protein